MLRLNLEVRSLLEREAFETGNSRLPNFPNFDDVYENVLYFFMS